MWWGWGGGGFEFEKKWQDFKCEQEEGKGGAGGALNLKKGRALEFGQGAGL